MFATGSLDEPVLFDNFHGIPIAQSSIEGRYYPDFLNYDTMTGYALNQNPYGVCYMVTSINWCKYWVWRHTGKKLSFSLNETLDCAADAYNLKGDKRTIAAVDNGGKTEQCVGLLRFNTSKWQAEHKWSSGKSELITEFEKICEKNGINESNLYDMDFSGSKDNAIKVLSTKGPFYWAHYCQYYSSTSGNHAVLGCGFDKDYFYFKNSWSSSDDEYSYRHYGKLEWDKFPAATRAIRCYTSLIMNNL